MCPLILELLEHRGVLECLEHLVIEFLDDLGISPPGQHDPLPGAHFKAGEHRFSHCRHVWQQRAALRARHGQRLDAFVPDEGHGVVYGVGVVLNLAADEICHGGGAAAVRDMDSVNAGGLIQQKGPQVGDVAVARRGVGKLAGILLRVGDEFGNRVDRQLVIDDQDKRHDGGGGDRDKVLFRIERHILVK